MSDGEGRCRLVCKREGPCTTAAIMLLFVLSVAPPAPFVEKRRRRDDKDPSDLNLAILIAAALIIQYCYIQCGK